MEMKALNVVIYSSDVVVESRLHKGFSFLPRLNSGTVIDDKSIIERKYLITDAIDGIPL